MDTRASVAIVHSVAEDAVIADGAIGERIERTDGAVASPRSAWIAVLAVHGVHALDRPRVIAGVTAVRALTRIDASSVHPHPSSARDIGTVVGQRFERALPAQDADAIIEVAGQLLAARRTLALR